MSSVAVVYFEKSGRHLSGSSVAASTSVGDTANASDVTVPVAAVHSSSQEHQANHSYEALFFFFNAIILGTAILHLTNHPRFQNLQQTVCLFCLGVLYSLIQEGLQLKEHLGIFGRSYDMWMNIDPHLLLFTMLPALLAGDAMTIDTSVARTVAKQCLFLAGPGVLIGSFATALFLWVYIPDWDFLLCLTTGSILAATDPVAVVGLLKELGASPILTMQIQGESLLNDGTAIVLYTIAYNMLSGEEYDASEILIFLVLVAFCAVGLGLIIGWLTIQWIKMASDRLSHHAGMIQTALTLCCAYWSFTIAEGALKISGVLCTVTASLVLADKMWPLVVDKHSMHHIWHMIEYLGNTIIFFLAGALTGNTMIYIPFIDYLRLLVIYIVSMLIRGSMLFGSRPILRLLSAEKKSISVAEATVMTWGGLRGAVGLALAIQVSLNRADGRVSEMDGRRVLFYVGGVAALTLVVNATTCPSLVSALGVTRTPAARQQILYKIFSQLHPLMMVDEPHDCIKHAIEIVLGDLKHHIDALVPPSERYAVHGMRRASCQRGSVASDGGALWGGSAADDVHASRASESSIRNTCASNAMGHFASMAIEAEEEEEDSRWEKCKIFLKRMLPAEKDGDKQRFNVRSTLDICEHLEDARKEFHNLSSTDIELLDLPPLPFEAHIEELELSCREHDYDSTLVRSVHTSFLSLLSQSYWHQLEAGEFIAGAADAEMLLSSVSQALRQPSYLSDLTHLLRVLRLSHQDAKADQSKIDEVIEAEEDLDIATTSSRRLKRVSAMSTLSKLQFSESTANFMEAMARFPGFLVQQSQGEKARRLVTFIDSTVFSIAMSGILIVNSIFILVEQTVRNDDNYHHPVWLVIELAFTCIFISEFCIKFTAFRCGYFFDGWNNFDFLVLGLSLFGLAMELLASGSTEDVSNEARIFRLNRLFRVLRILRVFRLVNFFHILMAKFKRADISLQLAEHLRTITALRSFVKAHVESQSRMLELFGHAGNFVHAEEIRCILESQTEIYRAVALAVQEAAAIETSTLIAMQLLRESIGITSKLAKFVYGAEEVGVITAREAETIAHPLHDHVRLFAMQMKHAIQAGDTSGVERQCSGVKHALSLRAHTRSLEDSSGLPAGLASPRPCTPEASMPSTTHPELPGPAPDAEGARIHRAQSSVASTLDDHMPPELGLTGSLDSPELKASTSLAPAEAGAEEERYPSMGDDKCVQDAHIIIEAPAL